MTHQPLWLFTNQWSRQYVPVSGLEQDYVYILQVHTSSPTYQCILTYAPMHVYYTAVSGPKLGPPLIKPKPYHPGHPTWSYTILALRARHHTPTTNPPIILSPRQTQQHKQTACLCVAAAQIDQMIEGVWRQLQRVHRCQ